MAYRLRRQAIIWTNDGLLWIVPLETKFSEMRMKVQQFSFSKMDLQNGGHFVLCDKGWSSPTMWSHEGPFGTFCVAKPSAFSAHTTSKGKLKCFVCVCGTHNQSVEQTWIAWDTIPELHVLNIEAWGPRTNMG